MDIPMGDYFSDLLKRVDLLEKHVEYLESLIKDRYEEEEVRDG